MKQFFSSNFIKRKSAIFLAGKAFRLSGRSKLKSFTRVLCMGFLLAGSLNSVKGQTFTNGQNASYVVGQPNFISKTSGLTSQQIEKPSGVAIDVEHGKMYVADFINGRVLRFSYPLTGNYPVADLVFGQENFTAKVYGCTANKMASPCGLAVDASGNLWVADYTNKRVLKFNTAYLTTANGVNADVVIGQENFTSKSYSAGLNHLFSPANICFDTKGNLWISDCLAYRVLRFNAGNQETNATANGYLGTGFAGTTQNQFAYPSGITCIGTSLFVSDAYNNRVLRFDKAEDKADASEADGVLGQPDFATKTADDELDIYGQPNFIHSDFGIYQNKFGKTSDLTHDDSGNLYITDGMNNNRILIFNHAVDKENNANADAVLGQSDFTTGNESLTQNGLALPNNLAFDNVHNILFVADYGNTRVLAYSAISAVPEISVATAATGIIPTGFTANWGTVADATSYSLEVSADNFATQITGSPFTIAALTITKAITGLTSGTTYKYKVKTVNAGGSSAYSNVKDVTITDVPGAPTSATATAGNASATVSFTAPASNGGSAILSYTVTSSLGGFSGTGTTSPISVTGLTNGTSYSFTVTAINSVGTSAASTASNSVTPSAPNTAPTDITLSANAINEKVAANSTVGTLTSTDADAGNTFTYTLVAGTGSTDNASFNISENSLRITNSPDYGTKSSYSIRIRTTDQGGLFNEKAFIITITDVIGAPTFNTTPTATIVNYDQPYSYSFSASHEGDLLTTLTATTLPAWMTISADGTSKASLFVNISTGAGIGGIATDDDGNIYAINYGGTEIFKIAPDGTTSSWKSGLISGRSIYNLHIANGYIYIPYYQNSTNSITRIPLNNPSAAEETFASLTAGALSLTDNDGWIYASDYTAQEIVRINETTKVKQTILTSANGIPSAGPFGLTFDKNGDLYIATYTGRSILKYHGTSQTTVLSGLPNNIVSIKLDNQGNFYIAMSNGGVRKYTSDFSSYESVSLNTSDNVWNLAITPNGSLIYSIFQTNKIYRLQTGAIIKGTPAKSDVGVHPVVLRAENSAGYTEQKFNITVVDNVAPVISAYSPAINATEVPFQPTLSVNFDEEVSLGTTGTLDIYNGASLVKSFDLSVPADKALLILSTDKKMISVTLADDLPCNTLLSVGISAGFVKDIHDNNFIGFTAASNTWKFTTIDKSVQTITYPTIAAKTYGDAIFTLGDATTDKNLTVTYTADDPTVVSIVGNQATILKAGTTKITVTQAGDHLNLALTPVERSLTVNKALLTVTADAKTKVYGVTNPTLTFQYSGWKNSDTETVLETKPTASTTVVLLTNVGTYNNVITVTGGIDDSYAFNYIAGNFSITAKPITVTANADQKKVYGSVDPTFTYSVAPALSGSDAFTGALSRATGDNVGSAYAINQGTLSAGTNYTITFVSKSFSITQKALSVNPPTLTSSKTYNGSTLAVVSAGTLSGVVTADAGNVTVSAVANYTNSNIGSGKTINVVYTLSGSASGNYTKPVDYTVSNGVITAKQLTISNTIATTNKMYDGNTTAVVTSNGTLSGVETVDAANVTVSAVANYADATVGLSKTITVVYTLGGSASGNYIAPANLVINTAKISEKIVLQTLIAPTAGCEGFDMTLSYTALKGTPVQYQVIFGSAALSAGFQDISFTNLASPATANGTVSIPVSSGIPFGTYQASLQMRNELGIVSDSYPFQLVVNVSTDYIISKFDDVVLFDNHSNGFTSYQWYKNGSAINGATNQFYNDPSGLVGTYSLKLKSIGGQALQTCPKVLNIPKAKKVGVSVYPNPMRANQQSTVKISGLSDEELQGAVMTVYNIQGLQVYSTKTVEQTNSLTLQNLDGSYVGHIITAKGNDYVYRIILVK